MTGKELKEKLQTTGLSLADIAGKLGMSPQHLNQALNAADIKSGLLERVCAVFGFWGGNLYADTSATNIVAEKSFNSGVPYYNVDFALGFDLVENDQTRNPDYLIDCSPYNKCDLWCNAHGDSMAPTIASGDIVALKRIEDFRYLVSGEIYALVTRNGLRTIKRVNDNGDTFTLIPDNKDFAPQTLPKEEFTHVFVVKGSMKMF